MKNLYFYCIALLIATAANAQTAAEKALVGKWNITSVGIEGNTVELDTGKIVFTDEALKEAKEAGVDIEDAKRDFKALGQSYKNINLSLNANGTLQMKLQNHMLNDETYTITEKDGRHYIVGQKSGETEYTLVDGVLLMMVNKGGDMMHLYFKKE